MDFNEIHLEGLHNFMLEILNPPSCFWNQNPSLHFCRTFVAMFYRYVLHLSIKDDPPSSTSTPSIKPKKKPSF
jgi:hypothetical protein